MVLTGLSGIQVTVPVPEGGANSFAGGDHKCWPHIIFEVYWYPPERLNSGMQDLAVLLGMAAAPPLPTLGREPKAYRLPITQMGSAAPPRTESWDAALHGSAKECYDRQRRVLIDHLNRVRTIQMCERKVIMDEWQYALGRLSRHPHQDRVKHFKALHEIAEREKEIDAAPVFQDFVRDMPVPEEPKGGTKVSGHTWSPRRSEMSTTADADSPLKCASEMSRQGFGESTSEPPQKLYVAEGTCWRRGQRPVPLSAPRSAARGRIPADHLSLDVDLAFDPGEHAAGCGADTHLLQPERREGRLYMMLCCARIVPLDAGWVFVRVSEVDTDASSELPQVQSSPDAQEAEVTDTARVLSPKLRELQARYVPPLDATHPLWDSRPRRLGDFSGVKSKLQTYVEWRETALIQVLPSSLVRTARLDGRLSNGIGPLVPIVMPPRTVTACTEWRPTYYGNKITRRAEQKGTSSAGSAAAAGAAEDSDDALEPSRPIVPSTSPPAAGRRRPQSAGVAVMMPGPSGTRPSKGRTRQQARLGLYDALSDHRVGLNDASSDY